MKNGKNSKENLKQNIVIKPLLEGGFSEMEAQVKTIKKLSQSFDIDFWEVSYNG